MLTVGVFQGPQSSGDVSANLGAIDAAAGQAAAGGAAILITPEMSATGYNIGTAIAERAEPADGPIAAAVGHIARRHGLAIVYGYPEANGAQGSDSQRPFNSTQVIDANGEIVANYRKTHLYGFDRTHFTPGSKWVQQFDFGGLRCGLLICYDIEFPENVRAHADAGTEWLIVPTGLMEPYEHIATQLVPTRAYESQLFVTYVNRCGTEFSDTDGELTYCGLSCAIAPDASEIARAGNSEQLLIAAIDPAALATSRAVNTHLADRRRDLYQENTSR